MPSSDTHTLVPLDERFLDLLPAAVYMCDASGVIRHYNRRAAELWGRTPQAGDTDERFCGAFRLYFPDGRFMAHADTPMAEALRTGAPQRDREAVIERPDGSRVAVSVNIDAIYGPNGELLGAVNVFQDITARKLAQQDAVHLAASVEESDQRFRQMAEHIDDVFWMGEPGPPLRMLYISPAYEKIWGRPLGTRDDDPLSFMDAVHPEDRHRVAASVETLMRGEPAAEEYRIVRPDGTVRWIWDRGFPIKNANGEVVRFTGIAEDITEKKRAQELLREADRRKDEFLATLAHELRNPLAPIGNAIQLLALTGPHDAKVDQARRMMERQVQQMVRLVDDLLDVSRITRGTIELRKDRTTLSQVVASAVETSGPLIETGRHDLDVSLPAQEVVLEADPTRLAQVFANLLNNAAKYTEPGGVIQLSAAVEGNRVVVKVSDNGVGMNKRAQTDIFDMFVQAHQHRGGGGLGIGLTVAKSLVEMHGGTIAVASAGPGRGSEFVVRLPIESERPGSSTTVESGASRTMRATAQRRILVVDDNIDAAESLAALLGALGHEVSVAHGGQRALEINSSFAPELIFLDLGMPGMDGYEVAKRLRGTMSVERPQIIAMTGWGQDGDRRRTREAGFDFHLVKPVSLESLQSLLSDDGAAARATGSASTGSPPSAS